MYYLAVCSDELFKCPDILAELVRVAPARRLDEFNPNVPEKPYEIRLPSCELYSISLTINARGDIFPCNFHRDAECVIGNIRTASLKETWLSSKQIGPNQRQFSRCRTRGNQ
jgi:hypothetical protein